MGRVKIFGVELVTTEDGAGWLAQSRGSELVPPLSKQSESRRYLFPETATSSSGPSSGFRCSWK